MKSFLKILDWNESAYYELFDLTDKLIAEPGNMVLKNKAVVLFFPDTSIRTRMTFELGIKKFGGNFITFPDSTLSKPEKIEDVVKYFQNWVDAAVVRYSDADILKEMVKYADIPIINAMTSEDHPCEIIHDIYAIKNMRNDFKDLKYLYIGPKTNIGNSWYQASQKFGFQLIQVCPKGYEIEEQNTKFNVTTKLNEIISEADVIITDTIINNKEYIQNYQIDNKRMDLMKNNAIFIPTPPFYRGGVVSNDVNLQDTLFAGYEFKRYLLEIEAAIICKCLSDI